MAEKYRKNLLQAEAKRGSYKTMILVSKGIQLFGKSGIIIPALGEYFLVRLLFNLVVHGSILMSFYELLWENWFFALPLYVLLHIGLFFLGKLLVDRFESLLSDLEIEVQANYDMYIDEKCIAHNIFDGVYVQDNLSVTDKGQLKETVSWLGPMLDIYFLESLSMKQHNEYLDRKTAHNSWEVLLNEQVAYGDFNNKFAVFTNTESKFECISLFSPNMQIKMVKALGETRHLKLVRLSVNQLTSDARWAVEGYSPYIDLHSNKLLTLYFDEVDTYCEELQKKGKPFLEEAARFMNVLGIKPVEKSANIGEYGEIEY